MARATSSAPFLEVLASAAGADGGAVARLRLLHEPWKARPVGGAADARESRVSMRHWGRRAARVRLRSAYVEMEAPKLLAGKVQGTDQIRAELHGNGRA